VFYLKGDKTLYGTHLFALRQNVGNVVHYVVIPSINLLPSHSMEPLAPKVANKLGLNLKYFFHEYVPYLQKHQVFIFFSLT
jgi:hypothetical protein